MQKRIVIYLILFGLILTACNFPGTTVNTADQDRNAIVLTAAAETVSAALTQDPPTSVVETTATVQLDQTETPVPTETPLPSATIPPLPTITPLPTKTPLPCNMATFIKDVTIPDDTEFEPGDTFTKTWRLKNLGTCTWTSEYDLVFDDGDVMGGDIESQLTSGTVAPGQTVDISIELTAPATEGTYRGNWRLRDENSVIFGLTTGKSFWVQIKVVAPAASHQITLSSIGSKSGSVLSNGTVISEIPDVGDTSGNKGSQAFVSFDISGIPTGATITEVKVNFSAYVTDGDPFGGLDCLYAYAQSYQPLDAGDYTAPGATNELVSWCSTGELDAITVEEDLKQQLQSELGGNWLQLRLQFKDNEDDGDGIADMVRFYKDIMKLIVTYTSP